MKRKQIEQYNHDRQITCDRLGITINQYNKFRLYGQKLHKIYEDQCNGDESEATEREAQVLTDAVTSQAFHLNLHIFLQMDPRGATVYLSKDPIEDNNYNRWGSECIY